MTSAEIEKAQLARLQSSSAAERRAAAAELFELTHRDLFQVALRMTGRREWADEAVQETFVRVLRSVAKFRGESKLSTWIYRICMREALRVADRSRRAGTTELPEDLRCDRPGQDATLSDAEGAARILAAIAKLPDAQRVVFSLAAVEELAQTEIAEILGVPVGTVYSRLAQARETLRESLSRCRRDPRRRT